MTFRLRHEWKPGATLPELDELGAVAVGCELATCVHCETLRAAEPHRTTYIRRRVLEAERVTEAEPPCIAAAPFFKAPW